MQNGNKKLENGEGINRGKKEKKAKKKKQDDGADDEDLENQTTMNVIVS